MSKRQCIVTFEVVRDKIVVIRGQQVILDYAVAELYGVETREINQAVKNNPRKFPKGWMFELDKQETTALRSKILMLNPEIGRGKYSCSTKTETYNKKEEIINQKEINTKYRTLTATIKTTTKTTTTTENKNIPTI